jgi:uncharacterized protein YqeY
MKAQDPTRRETLRLILAATHNVEVDQLKTAGDEVVVGVLRKQARMRREAIEAYERGARPDLAAKERDELAIIESYLPAMLDRTAITDRARDVIARTGARSTREQGAVMKELMAELRGRADGKLVAAVVTELLSEAR